MTGKEIIAKAKTFLGKGGTQFWKDYGCPQGWAWCVIFVWDIFRMCNASKLFCGGAKVADCGTEYRWCKANLTQVSLTDAREGDIVIYTWRKGEYSHTGLFIQKTGTTTFNAIEGNTNSTSATKSVVAIRSRAMANVVGIFRPKYTTPKPSKEVKINKTFKVLGKTGANVRSGAGTNYRKVGGISYNKNFVATKQLGDWVYTPTYKGWVCLGGGKYCKEVAVPTYKTYKVLGKNGANIRAGAGTNYRRVGGVPYGRTFKSERQSGDWAYSSQLGGWVCIGGGKYLKQI